MKGIIVQGVVALILKASTHTTTAASNPTTNHNPPQSAANWNAHACYFAAITFNQIVLSKADTEVVIDVYFELFNGIRGEGKETGADGTAEIEDGKENGASGKTWQKDAKVGGRGRWKISTTLKRLGRGRKKRNPNTSLQRANALWTE